ncbi:CGNR zinc finger domain-containing protein [Actinophytocola gossypii]|uniref:CGNR zinc finger domain-containing protein n=1 Tax=Actinophytocola gossypii TaxID=2812003 RepID=A0ABT2J3T8_9PSEU|nr:CGNR zinc finger domain-containing protein [Actinophytocola gossypii]MCT2582522.1 CGNR zinc finger domain-containing protein [Actinophytocola gossypii]
MRRAAIPPFRTLDPALAAAERLLAGPGLSTVLDALPDERAAAARLNALLASLGAGPRLRGGAGGWRVVLVDGAGEEGDLVTAAGGVVALVAVAGWSRFKRCERCDTPFVDRTNGRTRRWCAGHRPNR